MADGVMSDNARALGRYVQGLQLNISDKDAQIRDLQQALRTERDARKAAEEARDGYRKLYERAVGGESPDGELTLSADLSAVLREAEQSFKKLPTGLRRQLRDYFGTRACGAKRLALQSGLRVPEGEG